MARISKSHTTVTATNRYDVKNISLALYIIVICEKNIILPGCGGCPRCDHARSRWI